MEGCYVLDVNGSREIYDGCILGVHAPDALRILGEQATYEETKVLGAFQYVYRYFLLLFFLHYLALRFESFQNCCLLKTCLLYCKLLLLVFFEI